MSIFEEKRYRMALFKTLESKKKAFPKEFNHAHLAEYCGFQKTYLSRIFKRQAHLTEEQLWMASAFLGINNSEKNFLILLRRFELAKNHSYKESIRERLDKIREEQGKTESHLQHKQPLVQNASFLAHYFLDPNLQLAHVLLSLKRFAENPSEISNILEVSKSHLKRLLDELERHNVVKLEDGKYRVITQSIHLPKDSLFNIPYRTQMRVIALRKLARDSKTTYSFSVVFSANEHIRAQIQKKFLDFLSSIQEAVMAAPEENVYQLNFDLFNWTE